MITFIVILFVVTNSASAYGAFRYGKAVAVKGENLIKAVKQAESDLRKGV